MYRFISNIEYIQEFLGARPDLEEYEEYLNDQMRAFDEREQKRLEDLERRANEPDEDGFVTVVSKRPVLLDEEDAEEEVSSRQKPEEPKVLPNFYQFQIAGQKRNQIDDLRAKFDEDKRRIAELKRAKLFQ